MTIRDGNSCFNSYYFQNIGLALTGYFAEKINAVPGNNEIPWGGKDNDGDYISNGTYLYKMVIPGQINPGLPVGKLAILK